MADTIIKNTKKENESAHKTGFNLSMGKGINKDGLNPGALTGPKASEYKFNTMNLPIMGSNFQVIIGAEKEKTFGGVSSVQALYLKNNANIINEGYNGSSEEEYIPQHYDWDIKVNDSTGKFYLDPEPENGTFINATDTITLTTSLMSEPISIDLTVENITEDIIVEEMSVTKGWIKISKDNPFVYTIIDKTIISNIEVGSATQNMCVGLYNGSDKVELVFFYYYSNSGMSNNLIIDYDTYYKYLQVPSMKGICSLTTSTCSTADNTDPNAKAFYDDLSDKYSTYFYYGQYNEKVFKCADEDIVVDYILVGEEETHTIHSGEYYFYYKNAFAGYKEEYYQNIEYLADLYIFDNGNIEAGLIVKPVENNQQ